MIKYNKKKVINFSFLFSSLLFLMPVTYAATATTQPAPVCTDDMDEETCTSKLNSFCALPENAQNKECLQWKTVQEQVKNNENNDSNVSTPSTGGSSSGGMSMTLMFSPSAFAAQQSIGLIQQIFTCKSAMSEEEKALPNRLSANLCIYVGEYCSKTVKILGVKLCQTKKKTYCCFNSTLARIINTEGNKQLGRGMGDPENATCQGFTIDEFNRIDLSKMDLSEFVAEVTAKSQASASKNQGYWKERNETRMEKTWQNANSEDLQYKILTADDPYSVVSQPTDGKAAAQREGRVVQNQNEANTPTAKETGKNPVNQAELDQAKQNFINGTK
ncbi:conjugal transfer protein TraN [Acinetobacter baumannii]